LQIHLAHLITSKNSFFFAKGSLPKSQNDDKTIDILEILHFFYQIQFQMAMPYLFVNWNLSIISNLTFSFPF